MTIYEEFKSSDTEIVLESFDELMREFANREKDEQELFKYIDSVLEPLGESLQLAVAFNTIKDLTKMSHEDLSSFMYGVLTAIIALNYRRENGLC